MSTGHAEPQGADRFEGLVSLFERIRERPGARTGDRLRPLLISFGSEAEAQQVAHRLVERCRDDPGPVSHITTGVDGEGRAGPHAFTDLALLLRHVTHELSQPRQRFEPGLRFPMLSMLLWLLELRRMRLDQAQAGDGGPPDRQFASDAQRQLWGLAADLRAAAGDDAGRRTLLGRGIRSRRRIMVPAERPGQQGRLASALSYLEQMAPIGVALIALVSATAASTLDLLAAVVAGAVGMAFVLLQVTARTRDWAGGRRYRWFTSREQRYVHARSSGFLGFALEIVDRPEAAPGTPLDAELERLLVAAFLHDLRSAYRRGIWRAAWARVRYPAVVVDRLPEGDPNREQSRRFVERVEEVRRAEERFDPLVVAVLLGSRDEARTLALAVRAPLGEQSVADLDEVRESAQGNPLWTGQEDERRRVAVLGTRRELRVDAGRGDGASTEPVYRGRRRPLASRPAVPWIVAGTLLAASVSVISFQAVRYCSPVTVRHAPNGECIGISDGSYVFHDRLQGVERRIEALNDQVIESGKPYVTIVYLGPMTTDPANHNSETDLLAGNHGELVGLSIAQQRHNAAGGRPRLRILLANTGSRFRYARAVAGEIRRRAAADPTIVGVVGFGQSRRQTQEAIDELAKSALPMVGTTNTFDGTGLAKGRFSPYYFRLAPPNRRLAEHAAHWARNGQTGVRATTADVFLDTSRDDQYSRNLAQDFAAAFAPGKVRTLAYSDPSQVSAKVQEACTKPSEVFYYAGRSDEFQLFVNKLANTECGGRRIVMAGDEVTKYVSDNAANIGRTDSVRLFFSPLAAREAWDPAWVGGQPLHVFYSTFGPVVDELVGAKAPANARPSLTHAALGYDAARAVIGAAERIYGDQDRTLPTAAAILSELTEPGEGALPQGATGLLRFGPRSGGHQIEEKPVLLSAVRPPDGRLEMVAVCGRLVSRPPGAPDGCPPAR
ncbi:ABC transporter substrate-binding protein [Spirillospora sp. NPDC029432]|uniref:ABC transporter substrate-binding protein n=1 Tax=Spirillospora sp. NPDC029432 TaxID=3154599 RepID=UPI003453EA62